MVPLTPEVKRIALLEHDRRQAERRFADRMKIKRGPFASEAVNRARGRLGATIDCMVRNLSDRGACLAVESSIGIPDSFDLVLNNGSVRDCRVTWRKATKIGAEFA
jgi:hypothetical protein